MPSWDSLVDRLANPIMVKELRAGTRGARFFIAHLVIVVLFSICLMLTFATMMATQSVQDPSLIGKQVFLISQAIQCCAVFLIVPAYAATAITTERERQTMDILMSTSLTAWQIAWGKLIASMTQVSMIFVSLVPLVGLTFLFGGVNFTQVLWNYIFLLFMSVTLSVWALSVSASVQSTQRAVISIYAGTILVGLMFWGVVGTLGQAGVLSNYLVAYGFIDSFEFGPRYRLTIFDGVQNALYVYGGPIGFLSAVIVFFYLHAVTRLQPVFADRSFPHRIFYFFLVLFILLFMKAAFMHDLVGAGIQLRINYVGAVFMVLLVLMSASTLFACEEPVPIRHLREKYANLANRWKWMRFLGPGADAGWRFIMVVNVFFAALAFVFMANHADGFNQGDWSDMIFFMPILIATLLLGMWIYFLASFARFMATVLPNRKGLLKLTVFGTALILALAPMLHWALSNATRMRPMVGDDYQMGPPSLALSPVAAIWTHLMPTHGGWDLPMHVDCFGMPVPMSGMFTLLMGVGGTAFRIWGSRRLAALKAGVE